MAERTKPEQKLTEASGEVRGLLDELDALNEKFRQYRDDTRSFKKAIKTMQMGFTLTDLKGTILFTNPADAEMHGYEIEELVGRDVRVFAPIESWDPIAREKIISMKRWKRNSINKRKDGSTFPVHLLSDVVTGENKQPVGIITTCEDITDKKRMERELDGLFVNFVEAMVSALDAKSSWTKGHSVRVSEHVVEIATEMGLDGEELNDIRLAGLLHDIGKIGTYDYLLDKASELNAEEQAIMRKHPVQGTTILKDVKQLKGVLPIIRHHHERVDGNGYPDGLVGEEIPPGARIMHVADSFDSMTVDRPYRKSPGIEFAIAELKNCSGSQLDAGVVEVFLKVLGRTRD